MVNASPMLNSAWVAARCGFNSRPATEQNESGQIPPSAIGRAARTVSPRNRLPFRPAVSCTHPKQSTHIHFAIINVVDANITVRRNVHFQIRFEVHRMLSWHMCLDAKPTRGMFRCLRVRGLKRTLDLRAPPSKSNANRLAAHLRSAEMIQPAACPERGATGTTRVRPVRTTAV